MRLEDFLVLIWLVHTEVREKLSAACNLAEKPFAGGIILLVLMKVLRQFANGLRENGNLHLRRPGIALVGLVLGNDFLLLDTLERHKMRGGT